MNNRKEIAITVIHDSMKYEIKSYENEYRNLMALLNDHIYLENFGECGGQGRCATCLVKLWHLKNKEISLDRNEAATINKAGYNDTNYRLSCQLLITEDLQESIIDIIEIGI